MVTARHTDPESSHIAVAAIDRNRTLADHILTAAEQLEGDCRVPWDDTDLTVLIEQRTGQRQQRNVIARARGRLERHGHLHRIGIKDRDHGRTMHFLLGVGVVAF